MAGNVWLFAQDIKASGGPRKHPIHIFLSHIFLFRDFANRKMWDRKISSESSSAYGLPENR